MVKLTLPQSLSQLLPEAAGAPSFGPRSVAIAPGSWREVASRIRERFPSLAQRVFDESDKLAAGFVLVLNDEVVTRGCEPQQLQAGDEISVLAALAGG